MAAIIPTRTSGNISAHGFTGFCGIRRIVMQINTSINLGHGFKKAKALILRFAFIRGMLLWRSNSSLIFCLFNEKV